MNLIKNKKFVLVAGAIVFLSIVVFSKIQNSPLINSVEQQNNKSLVYDGLLVSELVNKDTDGDGILDWEEGLYGTDLNKKDTNGDGVSDNVEVNKIKETEGKTTEENLTQTDKFSRELFATVTALNQAGQIDQNTIDTLGASLSEKIKNPIIRKVYLLSDIKISTDDSVQAVQKYSTALNAVYEKNKMKGTAIDVLQEFINDGQNENVEALKKLDPIIKQTNMIVSGMVAISTPKILAQAHLDMINAIERLIENLNDIKLYETDPIVAMGAMSKYEDNTTLLDLAVKKLNTLINQKN